MTNTTLYNDPDTQAKATGLNVSPVYILDPVTQKPISPAASSGLSAADVIATGNITAAQATQGTPVANATVVLALGDGQATWEAQITGLGSGSTVAFDGVDDVGTSTNWQAAIGYNTASLNPAPITSIAGPGPFIIRGSSSGYEQVRIRCTIYNGTDTIAVRLIGSVGALGGVNGVITEANSAAILADIATIVPGVQGWIAPTGTGTATTDDSLTFASQVRKVVLYNAAAVPVPIEFDQTASATSFPLQSGQYMVIDDIYCTVLHVFPSATLPINTTNGLYVKGWK